MSKEESYRTSQVTRVLPFSGPSDRPNWSVMIPVYRTRYLAETLRSILDEGLGPDRMQIEVIDDCPTGGDAESIVNRICPKRIEFYRHPQRAGMTGNWNTCIERARGQLIHILHDDDFVASGYYSEIEALVQKYPEVGLYATRCFHVDEDSIITGVVMRVPELERPTRSTSAFFYQTPIEFAGVTVRRHAYEAVGGFRADVGFVSDCEMWARIVGSHGGVMSSCVKAYHRLYKENETTRLTSTAEGVGDICRLNELFSDRYVEFSIQKGRARASRVAWNQYQMFKDAGDQGAANANWNAWKALTSWRERLALRVRDVARPYIRRIIFGRGCAGWDR